MKPGINFGSLKRIMDDELLAILRGQLVPPGGESFSRKISRYEDLWEETRLNSPMPFQPRRSTFWDHPLASQRPSNSASLPAKHGEVVKVTPVQSPVGAERSSSKSSQLAPWLANTSTANSTSTQHWAGWNPEAKEYYPSSSLYEPSLSVAYQSPAAPSYGSVHPSLLQQAVASAAKGLASAASALKTWKKKTPNAGPLREVLSQSIYSKRDQTRHQEELELRKRKGKEEAAMRAGRAEPLF